MPRPVVLLGPQRFDPSLGEAVLELGVEGPIATITAGWQERESEDKELHDHLEGRTRNLRLWQRAEDVWKKDPELKAAHRARQDRMRHRQDFYRIRLEHALEAAFVIQTRKAPADVLAEEAELSVRILRSLDETHLRECIAERQAFDERWKPWERDSVARHREELRAELAEVRAVAIAGGHVATLLNRLQLFDLRDLLSERELPIFAWSAGAMAISERIVLFHDNPPQGPGAAEVLDQGLGLVNGVVPLPQPEQRLRLDDLDRVRVFARRFAPSLALAFPSSARVTWDGSRWSRGHGVARLGLNGAIELHEGWSLDGEGLGESLPLRVAPIGEAVDTDGPTHVESYGAEG